MAKYKIGDMFIATITDVNETGMGTTYTFNDGMVTTENVIDCLAHYNTPNTAKNEPKTDKAKEYTLAELKSRIFALSDLLAKTMETYRKAEFSVISAIDEADLVLKEGD